MDIYTFKEEFQKLMEPSIQRKLLPDYLKRTICLGVHTLLLQK